MKSLALLALLVAPLAACSKSVVDGCKGQQGTCISLVVRAGAGSFGNIDQIGVRPTSGFTFASGELRSPSTAGKTIALPAVVPILPDASFTGGAFALSVDAFASNSITGSGTTSGTVAAGKHVVVEVTLTSAANPDLGAGGDAGTDGGSVVVAAPRPITPSSGAYLTTRKPKLSWSLPAGADGARIELCTSRDCATITKTYDATGSSFVLPSALAVQVAYWRLRPMAGGAVMGDAVSATWEMVATTLDTAVNSFYGALPDVNGDGLADVAAGASLALVSVSQNIGTPGPGRAHVYLGRTTAKTWIGATTAPTADFNILDPDAAAGDTFGSSNVIGDLDGDGFAELIVSAPCAVKSGTACGPGRVHVFRGGPSGLSATSPGVDVSISAPSGASNFGAQLGVADLDLDGYLDLVVSSSGNSSVYVYRGGPSLFTGTPAPAWTLNPSMPGFGTSLSTGVDVNGDGSPDLLVGVAQQSTSTSGAVLQYFGGAANGWTSTGAPTPTALVFNPTLTGCELGASVALLGDADGDGRGDAVIGAPTDCGFDTGGIVFLLHGTTSGLDGTSAVVLSHDTGSGSAFGQYVMSGGDVNGDGKTEAILSAPNYTADPSMPGTIDAGHAIVLYGGNTVFIGSASAELAQGSKAAGYAQGLHFGGDIDGDGYDDLVVGSPLCYATVPPFGSSSYEVGKIDVFFGSVSGLAPTMPATILGPDGEGGEFGR